MICEILIRNILVYIIANTLFFTFQAQSFQTGCRVFIPAFAFPAVSVLQSYKRSESFLICSFISLLYIKPHVSINKQLSNDSFLDWEGHLWDFCLSRSSRHRPQFPPLL